MDSKNPDPGGKKTQWEPCSQPAQNCEGSSAVVAVAYHKPFEHLNKLAVDHNNQATHSTYARTSAALSTNKN